MMLSILMSPQMTAAWGTWCSMFPVKEFRVICRAVLQRTVYFQTLTHGGTFQDGAWNGCNCFPVYCFNSQVQLQQLLAMPSCCVITNCPVTFPLLDNFQHALGFIGILQAQVIQLPLQQCPAKSNHISLGICCPSGSISRISPNTEVSSVTVG